MISENPSEAELVQHGIDAFAQRLFKSGPGIVKAYDPLTNTAFVQPGIKRAHYSGVDGERGYRALPEIPFVPVMWPRAGGFVLRAPLQPGDSVLLVYCDESLAEWRESGGVAEPEDARLHSVGWPVAIPGLFPDSSPLSPTDAIHAALQAIFGEDGGKQVRIGPTGIEFAPSGVTPVSPVALAAPLVTALTALATQLTALAAAPVIVADSVAQAAVTACATACTAAAGTVSSTLVRSV